MIFLKHPALSLLDNRNLPSFLSNKIKTVTGKYKSIFLLIFSILLYSPMASMSDARNSETPNTLEGGMIINATEAKRLQKENKAFFADCRSAFNFGKGHIPGAKLISYQYTYTKSASNSTSTLKKLDTIKLPESKEATIVFYSHGITGWKSYKAAQSAIEAGYKRVLWLRGGLQEWADANYSIEN